MTSAARLNALTRLILVITLLLYFFCVGQWWLFLLLGLLLVIALYYLDQQSYRQPPIIENYVCRSRSHSTSPPQHKINLSFVKPQQKANSGFYPYA